MSVSTWSISCPPLRILVLALASTVGAVGPACSSAGSSSASAGPAAPPMETPPRADTAAGVSLPGGQVGIGLDDLRYSARLGRIVVPAGRTGLIDLLDPATNEITSIGGFTPFAEFDGTDQQGVQSADEGRGFVFAVDRSAFKLGVVDPATRSIVASVQLEHTEPDYVRWAEPTSEVWITNPGDARIEVLSVGTSLPPAPAHAAYIMVSGGVEGLVIDPPRRRAYTHSQGGLSVVDLDARKVVAVWPTGCRAEHGIPAIDEERGFVFAGCSSSEVVVLDAKADGAILGRHALGTGATILAYAPRLHHFYLRGDPGTTVAVLGIGADGVPQRLGVFESATRGHCATADDLGNVWVCDATTGRLLRFADPYPPTP